MPDRGLGAFVSRSLGILEREHPDGHRRLCAALGRRRVGLLLDGEPFVLAALGARLRLERAATEGLTPAVSLASGTVVELLDGELELLDALLADRVVVRGAIAELAELWESTRLYLHGLIRCPSIPPLLDALRAAAIHADDESITASSLPEEPRDQRHPS